MTKLKPLTINQNQIKRMKLQPVNSGFVVVVTGRQPDGEIVFQVVEFQIDEQGAILGNDGSDLSYTLDDGRECKWTMEGVKPDT